MMCAFAYILFILVMVIENSNWL